MSSLAHLSDITGNRARLRRNGSDENTHHLRVISKPYRITLEGRPLSGHADAESAQRRLAVLSRDGELDGYEIVRRGVKS